MANVEHNVLTGSDLHESKGIATAVDNAVYVADGATSGVFTQITPTNRVMVHSASDFPTAVAGVRTLVASTTYQIVGAVSIGSDRLVMSADTAIVGHNPELDVLTTTSSGNMITTVTDGLMNGVGFTCSSGTWLSIGGATNTKRFKISNCILTSCDIIGTVDKSLDFIFIDNDVRVATSGGLTLTGVSTAIRIQNCKLTSSVTPIIQFGSSVWFSAFVGFNIFDNPVASLYAIALNGVANANLDSTGNGYIVDNMILVHGFDILNQAGGLWTFRVHS